MTGIGFFFSLSLIQAMIAMDGEIATDPKTLLPSKR